jgi:hypothetical protein
MAQGKVRAKAEVEQKRREVAYAPSGGDTGASTRLA